MDLQLALGAVEDKVPEDVKPLWPEATKMCMMMWQSLDSMLSNSDEAQRGVKVAITEAAKSIGITLDDLRPPVDVCVIIILRSIREIKESSDGNASVRRLTAAQSSTAQSYHINTPQTTLMHPHMPTPGSDVPLSAGQRQFIASTTPPEDKREIRPIMSFVLKDVTIPAGSMTMAGWKMRTTVFPVRLDEANTNLVAYRCFQMIFIKRGNMTMLEFHDGNKVSTLLRPDILAYASELENQGILPREGEWAPYKDAQGQHDGRIYGCFRNYGKKDFQIPSPMMPRDAVRVTKRALIVHPDDDCPRAPSYIQAKSFRLYRLDINAELLPSSPAQQIN